MIWRRLLLVMAAWCIGAGATPLAGQWDAWVARDRGNAGIPLSMFATFIDPGGLIVYPFFEYYRDSDFEYEAGDLGLVGTDEHFGRYRASEGVLFLGYGITSRWAVELEASVISARLEKDPSDASALPDTLEQSGLGDVEGQLRYRWRQESVSAGEIFSYFETVFPLQRDKLLIGTPEWEFKLGAGYMRTRSWGTMAIRGAIAWAEGKVEPGEYAVEYIRGVSDRVRVYLGVEGSEDEIELIPEAQLSITPAIVLKLNSAFGLTSKATGWAPEVGIVFRF